jgi:hypothetical protein
MIKYLKELAEYGKRLVELSLAGGLAGAASYVAQNGLELSGAGLRGLYTAGALAAYGVLVKRLGDKDRPTVK